MSLRPDRRAFLLSLGALALPAVAHATPVARIALGRGGAASPAIDRALADALREELGRNRGIEIVDERHAVFVLNASVREDVAAATRPHGCVVSVLVEERRSGRLRAILEGSARAPSHEDEVTTDALLRVAVRSALRSLGRAIA
jgi:hypothetical protein